MVMYVSLHLLRKLYDNRDVAMFEIKQGKIEENGIYLAIGPLGLDDGIGASFDISRNASVSLTFDTDLVIHPRPHPKREVSNFKTFYPYTLCASTTVRENYRRRAYFAPPSTIRYSAPRRAMNDCCVFEPRRFRLATIPWDILRWSSDQFSH